MTVPPTRPKWRIALRVLLHALPFFLATLLLHDQLGEHLPLLPIPAGPAGTQAAIQSYGRWSWILLCAAALLLSLTLLLPVRMRHWAVGPVLGCLAGAVASRFLTPFYF